MTVQTEQFHRAKRYLLTKMLEQAIKKLSDSLKEAISNDYDYKILSDDTKDVHILQCPAGHLAMRVEH